MTVTIQMATGERATISGYKWTGDEELAQLLNLRLHPLGPPTDDPEPDRTAAIHAVADYGGFVVSADDPPEFIEERIY